MRALLTDLAVWLRDHAQDPALWWAGLAVSLGVVAVIVWGQLRRVVVPRLATWAEPPSVSLHPGSADLDAVRVALGVLQRQGHRFGPVIVGGEGDIQLWPWDETVAHSPEVAGVTMQEHRDGVMVTADVWVRHPADVVTLTHELAHALGYTHPRWWTPSGHLMHPHRARQSLSDTRGLEAQ